MTDSEPGTIWGREPAMVLALVQAVIALIVAIGLNLAPDQIGAILAVTAVVLELITRSRVSPAPRGTATFAACCRGHRSPVRSTCSRRSWLRADPSRKQRLAWASGRAPRSGTWPIYGRARAL
jgi:hypothetical protein